jgi:hypothetical protein
MKRWPTNLFSPAKPIRKRATTFCPVVETLENRLVLSTIVEVEPNDFLGSGQILPSDEPITVLATVGPSFFGEIDYFRFQGQPGQQIRIAFDYPLAPGSSPLTAYEAAIEVFPVGGFSFATALIPHNGTHTELDAVLPGSGMWTIKVTAYGPRTSVFAPRGTGNYTLQVDFPSAARDLAIASAGFDGQGNLAFQYGITGATLPEPGRIDVYWASGPAFTDRMGNTVATTQSQTTPGTYGPITVAQSSLGEPPVGATPHRGDRPATRHHFRDRRDEQRCRHPVV